MQKVRSVLQANGEGLLGSVKSRVAAFERTQNPVLRSISKPTWITSSRQRSTTDAVLSWLNAARRTGGTPTGQDTAGNLLSHLMVAAFTYLCALHAMQTAGRGGG